MFKPRFLGLIILLAIMLALSPISRAQACSCVAQTDSQLFDRADTVFTGTVTGRTDPTAGASVQSSLDPITWTFQADSVAKGSVTNLVQIVSARDAAACGSAFAMDTRYLVYARHVSGHLETGLCWGNRQEGQLTFTPVASVTATSSSTDHDGGSAFSPILLVVVAGAVAVVAGVARTRLSSTHSRRP